MQQRWRALAVCGLALAIFAVCATIVLAQPRNPAGTRYLLFQVFTYGGQSGPVVFPPQSDLEASAKDIAARIGNKGDRRNKLGICLGPLTLKHSDDEVRRLIAQGFEIARRNDLAVAFHIDDQMFWDGRKDLEGPENIEWIDWKGTLCSGRRLDWSATPTKTPPQLCLNSRAVQDAVKTRARLIGQELKKHVGKLASEAKAHLYAGTIAGWESMIGRDYATGKPNGYHALSNRGFSAARPPAQMNLELAQVIKDFVELWSRHLVEGGAPKDKIYSHIAFTEQGFEDPNASSESMIGMATADTAFGKWYQPGFSLYPSEDTLRLVLEPLRKHNNPPWIMAEGTNVVPNGVPGEATMESYLGKIFNHGAVIANIFSWGIGGEAERQRNIFRRATENPEALRAYRKFLSGQPLKETPRSATAFSPKRLQAKIQRIHRELPLWVHGQPQRLEAAQHLMEKLDRALKSNNFLEADATADEVLRELTPNSGVGKPLNSEWKPESKPLKSRPRERNDLAQPSKEQDEVAKPSRPGAKSVPEAIRLYGASARAAMKPLFDAANVEYPPKEQYWVALKQEKMFYVFAPDRKGIRKLILTYPIIGASGVAGPKLREGDKQVPEGFYRITRFRPYVVAHLGLEVNYPNAEDVAHAKAEKRTNLGYDILIHGSRWSTGCLAMENKPIEQLFTLAYDSGVKTIQVIFAPCDLRTCTPAVDLKKQPKWLPELYARLTTKLKSLPIPSN
jgi:hypothetical protein